MALFALLGLRCGGESTDYFGTGGGHAAGSAGRTSGSGGTGGRAPGTGGTRSGSGGTPTAGHAGAAPTNGGEGGNDATGGTGHRGGRGGTGNHGAVGGSVGESGEGGGAGHAGEGGAGPIVCGREVTGDAVLPTIIETEDDLRAFAGVSVFHGNLAITTELGLYALECLTRVDGSLEISRFGRRGFRGLDALEEVTGTLATHGKAESFVGLGALKHVGGDFSVEENSEIRDMQGLGALETVDGAFYIGADGNLESLAGLTSLRAVGTLAVYASGIHSLEGLGALEEVTETFSVFSNLLLADLTGAVALKRVGQLIIEGDTPFHSLAGLEALEEVGDLSLSGPRLSDLTALAQLTSLTGSLEVSTPASLEGLHNIESVGGSVRLATGARDLTGLRSLAHVGLDFQLGPAVQGHLQNLDGLQALESIGGELSINAPAAQDLQGIGQVSVAGDVTITGGFGALTGIENITIGDSLWLVDNEELVDLSALSTLTSLDGNLVISENQGIPNLEGFQNLATVGGDVRIIPRCWIETDDFGENPVEVCDENTALTSLYGLRGLTHIGGALLIERNPALPTCEAEWLRDTIGAANIDGGATITGNDDAGVCAP